MFKYILSFPQPHTHLIHVTVVINNVHPQEEEVHIPLWRPGRYEAQNYPKNILNWKVFGDKNNPLKYYKQTKNSWLVETEKNHSINIQYSFYADVLDAGGSYVDEDLVYINPINCLLYQPEKLHKECIVELNVPDDYKIATSLRKISEKKFSAIDVHTLFDSPIMASNSLQHSEFLIEDARIKLWFNGKFSYNEKKIISDFEKFCKKCKQFFGELPLNEYHFLFLMLPFNFRHGVEHEYSTVIAMGADENFDRKEFYLDFLGISCHEFFHLWNVKRLRPDVMFPYAYHRENYSDLGWVYEGVTTYYGDLLCLRAGVYTIKEWKNTFEKHLQKHFDNYGRYNLSLADSSVETWIDGYTPGIPNRKVSIYTEGLLASFILDQKIRKESKNLFSLDDLIKNLYIETYKEKVAYYGKHIAGIYEILTGSNFQQFENEVIKGCGYIEKYLFAAFENAGLNLKISPNGNKIEDFFGIKIYIANGKYKILAIVPESPADRACIDINYEVEEIGGAKISDIKNINDYISFNTEFTFRKYNELKKIKLISDGKNYYQKYEIEIINEEIFDSFIKQHDYIK